MLVNLAYGRTGLEVELPDDIGRRSSSRRTSPACPTRRGRYATLYEIPWAEGHLSDDW